MMCRDHCPEARTFVSLSRSLLCETVLGLRCVLTCKYSIVVFLRISDLLRVPPALPPDTQISEHTQEVVLGEFM